ncbi:MAG: hypothetical protein FWC70_07945 [Defluviitaleaceae bacterium]|nr:hypothetical protein [Defluviitaleaceae bacterium]
MFGTCRHDKSEEWWRERRKTAERRRELREDLDEYCKMHRAETKNALTVLEYVMPILRNYHLPSETHEGGRRIAKTAPAESANSNAEAK